MIFNILQDWHHVILANLRKRPATTTEQKTGGDRYYFVPKGLWFEYVDTPHYFCEILIYFSMLIICEFRNFLLYPVFGVRL